MHSKECGVGDEMGLRRGMFVMWQSQGIYSNSGFTRLASIAENGFATAARDEARLAHRHECRDEYRRYKYQRSVLMAHG